MKLHNYSNTHFFIKNSSLKLCNFIIFYLAYKSAISNLKIKNIKKFTIKNLDINKNRFNLVLEPTTFSKIKNGFCIKELGEMKSQRNLINLFKRNSILQYNKNTKSYYITKITIIYYCYLPNRRMCII